MNIFDWFGILGKKLAELLGISGQFQSEEAYGALGMSLVIILFFIFFGWLIVRKMRKTRKVLHAMAEQRGYSFNPAGKGLKSAGFFNLPLFQRGVSRGIKNVIRGRHDNVEFFHFQYWYTHHETPDYYFVTVFQTEDSHLPEFELGYEAKARAISEVSDRQMIQFKEDPGFSRRYSLAGKDVAAVRLLFNDDVRSFLAGRPPDRVTGVESDGSWLAVYRPAKDYMSGKTEEYTRDVYDALNDAFEFYDVFRKR